MTNLKFSLEGVDSAKANVVKRVEPGIHTVTITKLEANTSAGGTQGLRVEFASKEAEASFTETFWVTNGALPRIQYLIEKFHGEKHEGDIDLETLNAKLLGKTQVIIVDGREALSNPVPQPDGTVKVFTNIYPRLRFAGFVGENFSESDILIERLPKNDAQAAAPSTTAGITTPGDLPF